MEVRPWFPPYHAVLIRELVREIIPTAQTSVEASWVRALQSPRSGLN